MAYQWIQHSEHRHKIFLVNERNIFTCNRCFEYGTKNHYKCTHPTSRCSFHLHIACAEAVQKPVIKPRVYGNRYNFYFRTAPVNNHRYCIACGKKIRCYNYHCYRHSIDLHPSCSRDFPREFTVNNVRLRLKERLHGRCQHCNRSSYGGGNLNTWAYVSDCRRFQYFAGCILDFRVMQHQQALNRLGRPTNGYQVIHSLQRGGGNQILNVVVAGADFFNEVVRVFTGLPL